MHAASCYCSLLIRARVARFSLALELDWNWIRTQLESCMEGKLIVSSDLPALKRSKNQTETRGKCNLSFVYWCTSVELQRANLNSYLNCILENYVELEVSYQVEC